MTNTTNALPPGPIETLLETSLKDIGIPPRPVILERFSVEMLKPEPDYKRLSTIIGADVGLSAGLIKTANSPYFGYRRRVRSINEALMTLGLEVTSSAIAGILLRKAFPDSLRLERFWDASARIARLSGWLAQYLGIHGLRPEDAYTFGLFRDCGIPVLLRRHPEYRQILAQANEEGERRFTDIEDSHLPTNHAMVGHVLALSWWLPADISLAILDHHEVTMVETTPFAPPLASRYRIAIAQFAESLLQRHTGLSHTEEWPKLGAACLQLLNIAESDIDGILAQSVRVMEAEE